MAIANYEDRFVIPTAHRELGEDAYDLRGSCGFSFGNGCSGGESETNLFGRRSKARNSDGDRVMRDVQGAVRAAELSDRGADRGRAANSQPCSMPKDWCRAASRGAVDRLIDEIASGDLYDLQERYVLLFDRTQTLSLHLFEHVHGESRDRGQAMVDLKAMYENAGLVIAANELPDFVPLFLEFLSTQPLAEARELLGQTAHILAALAERLGRRESSYKAVFDALVAIAAEAPRRDIVDELLKAPDTDPMDLVALDAAWEEEEVRFGPGAQGQGACGHEGLIAKLRHARRAVDPAPSSLQ